MKKFSVLLLSLSFLLPNITSADTISDLQAQIAALMAQVSALQSRIQTLSGGASSAPTSTGQSSSCYSFTRNLKWGDRGADVSALQQYLNTQGYGLDVSGYFGPNTMKAVSDFQWTYKSEVLTPAGISRASGVAGTLTLNKLKSLSCKTTTQTEAVQTQAIPTQVAQTEAIQAQTENVVVQAIPPVSTQTPVKAVLQSPSANSTLAGASQTFTWTAGTNVGKYKLEVGTSQGRGDLATGELTTTSKTVSNLPTDGRNLYVRLWSYINGSWGSNYYDYVVKANTVAVAPVQPAVPPVQNSSTAAQRDAQRKADLQKVADALEKYVAKNGKYPLHDAFSAWDPSNGHTINTWSWNTESLTLYNALVGGGYIAALPADPINKEDYATGSAGGYLGDGPTKDLSYVYISNGTTYTLGTNLESGGGTIDRYGNYQLKGDILKVPALVSLRDAKRKADLQKMADALDKYVKQDPSHAYPHDPPGVQTWFSVWDYDTSRPASWGWGSWGDQTYAPTLYKELVGKGYLSALPLDPINIEANPNNDDKHWFLTDGPPHDFGYIYHSNGVTYTLGTNLEAGGGANAQDGNYQIKKIAPATSSKFRYLKVVVSQTNGYPGNLKEVEVYGTDNNKLSLQIIDQSSVGGNGTGIYNTIDGNTSSYWAPVGAGDHWIIYDLGSYSSVASVNIAKPNLLPSQPANSPTTLYYSNDNVTWVGGNSSDAAAAVLSGTSLNAQYSSVLSATQKVLQMLQGLVGR